MVFFSVIIFSITHLMVINWNCIFDVLIITINNHHLMDVNGD